MEQKAKEARKSRQENSSYLHFLFLIDYCYVIKHQTCHRNIQKFWTSKMHPGSMPIFLFTIFLIKVCNSPHTATQSLPIKTNVQIILKKYIWRSWSKVQAVDGNYPAYNICKILDDNTRSFDMAKAGTTIGSGLQDKKVYVTDCWFILAVQKFSVRWYLSLPHFQGSFCAHFLMVSD